MFQSSHLHDIELKMTCEIQIEEWVKRHFCYAKGLVAHKSTVFSEF